MTTVTNIRKVTPKHFADWLVKRTAGLHKEFSYDVGNTNVQIVLRQAKVRGALDNPSEVVIEGDYTYLRQQEGKPVTGGFGHPETYIRFQLTPLDDIRTEITTIVWSDRPEIENYCTELLAEIEKRWTAEGDNGGEPTFRDLQQFLFDADAKDVCTYLMGGETESRWVDSPYTLIAGKPVAFKGVLHPGSSPQALYTLHLNVYICDGETVDLTHHGESGYWIANGAFAAVILLSQDRPGTCTAQLRFQTNPLYWHSDSNRHCAPSLPEKLGELFVSALWQSWIDGWLAMRTVATTVGTDEPILRQEPENASHEAQPTANQAATVAGHAEASRADNQPPVKPVELSTRKKVLFGLLLYLPIVLVLLVPTLLVLLGVLPWQLALLLYVIGLAMERAAAWLGAWNNILALVEKLFSRK